jgi:hypothetical protein
MRRRFIADLAAECPQLEVGDAGPMACGRKGGTAVWRHIGAVAVAVAARCSDGKHGADGLMIVTEWEQFRVLSCDSIRARMVANSRRPSPARYGAIYRRACGRLATAFRLSLANYASAHARRSLQKLDISKQPSHLGAEGTEQQSPEACGAPVRLPCATSC